MRFKKVFLFVLFLFLYTFNFVVAQEKFDDKTKYPDIIAPSKDPAIEKAAEKLFEFNCHPSKSFGTIFEGIDIDVVKNFQKENKLKETGEIRADTWQALYSSSSKKCATSVGVVSSAQKNNSTNNNSSSGDVYQNVSSFDGSNEVTTFDNTDTLGMAKPFNYLLTLMAVAIVVLVIFRVLQGALIKGTFDNIYDQQKGKQYIKTAATAFIVFILVYAVFTFINPDLVNWTIDTKYEVDLSKSPYNNSSAACPADPYENKNLREIIAFNETSGRMFNYVNLDTKNIPTIGFGFNLKREGAKQSLLKAGVSEAKATQLVNATKEDKSLTLDDATINKLLDQDIADKKVEAVNYFKKEGIEFSSLPNNIQTVIIDMMFNVGVGGFDQFKKFKEAVKAKNWAEASRQIIDSNYCSQVKSRCYRNAALVSPGCGGALNASNTTKNYSIASQTSSRVRSPQISKEDTVTVCGIIVNKKIEQNVKDLCAAMKAAGFDPTGSYGWRSCEKQKQLYRDNCGNGSRKCSPATATPCTSNHGAGLAIDIKVNGGRSLCYPNNVCNATDKKAFEWLQVNAKDHGFYNLKSERWHWSTTGR